MDLPYQATEPCACSLPVMAWSMYTYTEMSASLKLTISVGLHPESCQLVKARRMIASLTSTQAVLRSPPAWKSLLGLLT